jgi:outer membrane protein OmpA-like peptidoglycan-associated protein
MTRPGKRPILIGLVTAALACACVTKRVATPLPPGGQTPLPPGSEMFVLLPDPDGGALGRASVMSPSGSMDLTTERSATQVSSGRAPAPPTALDEPDVQRIFGDALASLPPPPQYFNLYFRFESDDLTDEARELVPQILKLVTARPVPDIVVVGHTDTTGSTQTNFELGLKRATSVRNLLVEAGIDKSAIEVISHGELEPLIATPDDTLEPRNRRVEIAVR